MRHVSCCRLAGICLAVAAAGLAGCSGFFRMDSAAPPDEAPARWEQRSRGTWGNLPESLTPDRRPLAEALSPTEELWIVERTDPNFQVKHTDNEPGSGALVTRRPDSDREIPLPLKHTDVKARIDGAVATVAVTQQFQNPYDGKIEAVYVFPLPTDAAVHDFLMIVGERRIRGVIREREEARRIYADAKRQGYAASLLTQERPNIFTQSVANIEPGREIDVRIEYYHSVPWIDDAYEFVFPMVVGPRFNPPGSPDGIGAAARGDRGASGQPVEIQYLKPGERSGHDIDLAVDIDAGLALGDVASPSHAIDIERPAAGRCRVGLGRLDRIPNRDFILRYAVAGVGVKSAFLSHRDPRGGFFSLILCPPADLVSIPRSPMEMVFVIDCSGSMSGAPIEKARTAVERALKRLEPGDTFQIIRFSNDADKLAPTPLPATAENIARGTAYLRSSYQGGGTMMIEGIRAALDFPHDPQRLRVVSFLTDGYIGNETEIFGEVRRLLGPARIFSFGVGTSVNRYLIEGLARIGCGAAAFVGLDAPAGAEVDRFYERVRHPALTDVTIEWDGLDVSGLLPRRIPDVFLGRPVTLTGRFAATGGRHTIRITGRAGGELREIRVDVDLDAPASPRPALACLWARRKIAELSDFAAADANGDGPPEARKLALEYGLLSAFTSFVAVDASRVTEGDHGTTIDVPVPVPDGVKYDTTVKEKAK